MFGDNGNIFLVSENSLKEFSYIDRNIKGEVLTPAIKYVQDGIVENLLGTSLYKKLLFLINSGEISNPENECYKSLLDGYLFDLIAYSVLAEIQVPLTFKTRNKGNVQTSDDRVTPSDIADTKFTENHYRNRADYYHARLYNYLRCNCNCFTELKDCVMYGDKKPKSSDIVSTNFHLKPLKKWRYKP